MSEVHLAKKVRDLQLTGLKASEGFLNSGLLVSEVICKHVAEVSSLMTSPL